MSDKDKREKNRFYRASMEVKEIGKLLPDEKLWGFIKPMVSSVQHIAGGG